ncbi:MAG: extracellular solute-binding protein [Acidothermus sp.]|nr:extracellular solute-binding protein [Acidothermus sp.]MCL6538130.1 extracellular solute-binding protein [Acidothermus sp.]
MKRTLAAAAAFVAAMGLAACSSGKSSGGSPSAVSTPSAAASSSAAASPSAAASGKITVYAALTSANGKALADAFHASHPNETVEMVTAGTGALVTRMETEAKAGGVRADAILLADPTVMPQLASEGILGSYVPAAASQLPETMKGDGWFGAFNFYNVIIYHTGTTPVPKDWSDLTNPAYKGKIEIGDPSYSGTTLAMAAEVPKLAGADFFTKLKANDVKIVQSTNTVGNDVASGARAVGITLDSVYRPLAKKGSPVQIVWPASGAIPVPAPAGAVKGHEDNPVVKDFLDWLLTSEAQQQLVSLGYAPALGSSNAVPVDAKVVTVRYQDLVSQRSAILDAFKKVFG